MISRADLDDYAREWGVRLDIAEKDYVIGWLLSGIGAHEILRDGWVFKGGTCLKKCYIETYRFSEDLDFTVMPAGPAAQEPVLAHLETVLRHVEDRSGLDLSSKRPRLRSRPGGQSIEGRVYYRGPLGSPLPASIKLDLSLRETIARPTVLRRIAHPFPDSLPEPNDVRCYAFEELFAEKIRAMGERCRPRDLYDIVNLFRRPDFRPYGSLIANVLEAKCASKGIPTTTLGVIENSPHRSQLESEWQNMLEHQLPALPPFEEFWATLRDLFAWLTGDLVEVTTEPVPLKPGETAWSPPPTLARWGAGFPLETVRFAAVNRLCLEVEYQGSTRLIEPYSLRRTRAGHVLLYGLRRPMRTLRSYRIDRIQSVRATTTPFQAAFLVEFGTSGPLIAPDMSSAARSISGGTARSRETPFIVECPRCGRRFRRQRRDRSLRKHKDQYGNWCSGRHGRFV